MYRNIVKLLKTLNSIKDKYSFWRSFQFDYFLSISSNLMDPDSSGNTEFSSNFLNLIFSIAFFIFDIYQFSKIYGNISSISTINLQYLHCHKKSIPKLFFGIVTIESSQSKRQMMYETWINKTVNLGHDYVYCTQNKIEPQYKWIPLKNWANSTKRYTPNVDRENKRITMAEYFLKNTTADFFINPTDDVFVDASRINELATILGNKYNTNEDSIMLGNCLYNCFANLIFIQGGSGFLMTRKMARNFLKYAKKWVEEAEIEDDISLNLFLSYLNLTAKDAASPYFAGFGFRSLSWSNFQRQSLPTCPQTYQDQCGVGVMDIKDIYIFHANIRSMGPSYQSWTNLQQLIHDPDHKYGWYGYKKCRSVLCMYR